MINNRAKSVTPDLKIIIPNLVEGVDIFTVNSISKSEMEGAQLDFLIKNRSSFPLTTDQ